MRPRRLLCPNTAGLATVTAFLVVLLHSVHAFATEWEPAFAGRLGIGGGARVAPGDARGGIFELAPQIGMVIGSGHTGVGPFVEFRTSNFRTAEMTGGIVAGYSDGDFGGFATLAAGQAWRHADKNGAILTASLAYGVVSIGSRVVASTTLYVSFRHAATGPSLDEVTAGLSFGGGVLSLLSGFIHP